MRQEPRQEYSTPAQLVSRPGAQCPARRQDTAMTYSGKFRRRKRDWKLRAKRRHYRKQGRAPCGNRGKKFFNLTNCARLSFGKQIVRHSSSPTTIFHGCRDYCSV